MTDILTGERDGATVCAGVVAVPVDEGNSVRPADEPELLPRARMPASRLTLMPVTRCGQRAASAAYTTTRPTIRQSTGDACYIAQEHGIKMEHLDDAADSPHGPVLAAARPHVPDQPAAAARARFCSMPPVSALPTSFSRAMWSPPLFASR